MSVFSPMSMTGEPGGKKALLDQLMQQYQEAASRAAGLVGQAPSFGGAVGSTPFRAVHPMGGMGLYTGNAPQLPPGLRARLGPGAIGSSPGQSGHHIVPPAPPRPHSGGNPVAAYGSPSPFITSNVTPPNVVHLPETPLNSSGTPIDVLQQIVQRRLGNGFPTSYFGGGGRSLGSGMMAI